MLSRILGTSVAGPLFKGLASIVETQGVTKQVLAYCAVLKEVAAGTWRPWVARAIMWMMISYTLVSAVIVFYVLQLTPSEFQGGEGYHGHQAKLKYIESIWQPLGLSIFGFGMAFLGIYSGGRDHSKANSANISMLEALKHHLLPETPEPKVSKGKVTRRKDIKKIDRIVLPEDALKPIPKLIANDPAQKINLSILSSEIEADEDTVYEIYLDSLGNKTAGIGHLITASDEEYGQPTGTPVSPERVKAWFESDRSGAIKAAKNLLKSFEHQPQVVKHAFVNMAFQLGESRLSGFKKTIGHLELFQYNAAANEAMDSKWSKQTTARAKRVTARIRSGAEIMEHYDFPA